MYGPLQTILFLKSSLFHIRGTSLPLTSPSTRVSVMLGNISAGLTVS